MVIKTFRKIRFLMKLNVIEFIWLNYFSSNVIHEGKGKIYPGKNSIFDIADTASLIVRDGDFYVNYNKNRKSKAETYIILGEDSSLVIGGQTMVYHGSTIYAKEKAEIVIGGASINSGSVIIAANKINIGKDVLVSRGVYIYDADHHPIFDEEGNITNPPRAVSIGDHVWLGLKCTVLRGAQIGYGAMIAANSVVGGKIKKGTMAMGVPARSYTEIKWEK